MVRRAEDAFLITSLLKNLICSTIMKVKTSYLSISLLFMLLLWNNGIAQNAFEKYIEKYKDIAVREMDRTGIPASIKLAQALLESDAGRSELATEANNHFGIKCGSDWYGHSFNKKDDDRNRRGRLISSCFRSYKDPRSSFIDHSEFLMDPNKKQRYGGLFEIKNNNYKAWAKELKSSGYATNPKYANLLIDIIEKYKLDQFDKAGVLAKVKKESKQQEKLIMDDDEGEIVGTPDEEFLYNNDVRYTLAEAGETIVEISERSDISTRKILRFNEWLTSENQELKEGEIIYLQLKRTSYRGNDTWHKVKEGEKMYKIAQHYGLLLDKLYIRNVMSEGDEPVPGTRIKLKGSPISLPPRLLGDDPDFEENKEEDHFPKLEDDDEAQLEMDDTYAPMDTDFETKEDKVVQKEESKSEKSTFQPPVFPDEPVLEELLQPNEDGANDKNKEGKYPEYYLVRKGDTLYSIAQKFKISVNQLKGWNKLTSNVIRLGMRLRIR